jgi:hypothetical protein
MKGFGAIASPLSALSVAGAEVAGMLSKEEARLFRARWKLVNDFVSEEVRRTPPALKLQQLALMYEAGQALGWADGLNRGEEEVRERWRRLKTTGHV